MEVEQQLRKLKPLIGARADQYWLAYLAEDYKGKQELETALGLLAARLLGSDVETPQVHLSAPPEAVAAGDYAIGTLVYADKPMHPFALREDELIQHIAVFGRSGAGKTNTVFHILDSFLAHQKPFLIFDWKRNYRDLLAVRNDGILVYTVGRDTAPFVFNPLIPPEGTDPAVWLKKLIEIIAHSYYLGEGCMYLLLNAIHAVYEEYGVYGKRPERYPTFEDVLQWLRQHPVKGRQALWMDSTMRGVQSMCFGHMGNVVNTGSQPNIGALLEKNVILELDGLTNADKTLVTQALLLWIHHYRLAQPGRERFKHAIVIEEAHHILRKQTGGHTGEVITETILREIRELGTSILLCDQHPSLISLPALGNTYTTITMNLKHAADVSAVAAAMLLQDEEKEVLGVLPIGSAVVKLQARWPRAFRIQIPHKNIPKGSVNDTALAEMMKPHALAPPPIPAPAESESDPDAEASCELSAQEGAFLRDIIQHPLCGVVERYRRLGVSRRKGSSWKEHLTSRGIVQPVDIPTRAGRVVLLEPTTKGVETLRCLGVEVPAGPRVGGLEHEYWRHKVAERLRKDGYEVRMEEPVNGYADLMAVSESTRIAVEIETGKSDWRANIDKNLKKPDRTVLMIATNETASRQIAEAIAKDYPDKPVRAIAAQNFVECRDLTLYGLR